MDRDRSVPVQSRRTELSKSIGCSIAESSAAHSSPLASRLNAIGLKENGGKITPPRDTRKRRGGAVLRERDTHEATT
jgi:hypothetical protein